MPTIIIAAPASRCAIINYSAMLAKLFCVTTVSILEYVYLCICFIILWCRAVGAHRERVRYEGSADGNNSRCDADAGFNSLQSM